MYKNARKSSVARKCLMIHTVDGRKFFTLQKNFEQIVEFAHTFNAEVSTVLLKNGNIFNLATLATAISADEPSDGTYEIIEVKIPRQSKTSNNRQTNREIKEVIRKQFIKGEPVSSKEIFTKYRNFGLTQSYCNVLISQVVKSFTNQGVSIKKINQGKYQIA